MALEPPAAPAASLYSMGSSSFAGSYTGGGFALAAVAGGGAAAAAAGAPCGFPRCSSAPELLQLLLQQQRPPAAAHALPAAAGLSHQSHWLAM
jgi:hypothetical protein